MGQASTIEWTESTWNPLTGCTKISPGCKHCYAERMALRLQAMGQPNYANGFDLALHESALELPLKWKKPQTIFVNSMSDLFHKDVPVEFIVKTFDVMRRGDWHKFQVLTKRSDRLLKLSPLLPWAPHIWMGVSVESLEYTPRIDDLRRTGARVKFLSLEPLLGPLPGLNLEGIDWVITGGESGPGARPMHPAWVLEIRDQCRETSGASRSDRDRSGKANNHNPDMYVPEESHDAIVPMKPPNKEAQASAEVVEGRASIKENTVESSTRPTPGGERVSQGLGGVRRVARERKQERFTALLHHLTVDLLRDSYYALKRNAAPGAVLVHIVSRRARGLRLRRARRRLAN